MEGDTELGLLVKNTLDGIELPRFDPARLAPARSAAPPAWRGWPHSTRLSSAGGDRRTRHLPLYLAARLHAAGDLCQPAIPSPAGAIPARRWPAFLTAAWPRYYTAFDLVSNVARLPAARLPLGAGAAAAPGPTLARCCVATLCGAASAWRMETLQNFLPSRVPSNLDLACNSARRSARCAGRRALGRDAARRRPAACAAHALFLHGRDGRRRPAAAGAVAADPAQSRDPAVRQRRSARPARPAGAAALLAPAASPSIEAAIVAAHTLAIGPDRQPAAPRNQPVLLPLALLVAACWSRVSP